LLGMPVAELKEQFAVTLLSDKPDEVWLTLVPRNKELAIPYEKAVVILDRHTWLAKAIKTREITGTETVHVFKNMLVDTPDLVWRFNLSDPNLEGYRQVGGAAAPVEQPAKERRRTKEYPQTSQLLTDPAEYFAFLICENLRNLWITSFSGLLSPPARAIRPSERGSGGTRGRPRLLIPARLSLRRPVAALRRA